MPHWVKMTVRRLASLLAVVFTQWGTIYVGLALPQGLSKIKWSMVNSRKAIDRRRDIGDSQVQNNSVCHMTHCCVFSYLEVPEMNILYTFKCVNLEDNAIDSHCVHVFKETTSDHD